MFRNKRRIVLLLVMLAVLAGAYYFLPKTDVPVEGEVLSQESTAQSLLSQELPAVDGSYYSLDDVAMYIHLYAQLPDNYLTKSEAEAMGWDSSAGNLWEVAPGYVIGGDRFGNHEGLLPEEDGRQYYECDVNYDGGYRDAQRIVYSDDGLIFYTDDHYESFTQLYE